MKELNKLIEGIAFPIKYDEELRCFVDSSEEEYTICKPMGYFASAAGRHLIAHALNNLNRENHAISRKSNNLSAPLQPVSAPVDNLSAPVQSNNLQPKKG